MRRKIIPTRYASVFWLIFHKCKLFIYLLFFVLFCFHGACVRQGPNLSLSSIPALNYELSVFPFLYAILLDVSH
jgi:hypothetical protein